MPAKGGKKKAPAQRKIIIREPRRHTRLKTDRKRASFTEYEKQAIFTEFQRRKAAEEKTNLDLMIKWFYANFQKNIKQSTLSRIVNPPPGRARKTHVEEVERPELTRHRQQKWPELETALWQWQKQVEAEGTRTTGPILKDQAKEIFERIYPDTPAPKFSNGWLEGYKKRHGIESIGEAVSNEGSNRRNEGSRKKPESSATKGRKRTTDNATRREPEDQASLNIAIPSAATFYDNYHAEFGDSFISQFGSMM